MPWTLTFNDEIIKYFFEGRDDLKRQQLHHHLVMRATAREDYRNLQCGVPWNRESKHGANWTSIDLYDKRPCVDHNMDLSDLKFPDGSFDFIDCGAILEHVKDPFKCVREMHRVLNNDRAIWIEVPYVQAYHPTKDYAEERDGIIYRPEQELDRDLNHGGDYWRFTPQGLEELMKPFVMKRIYLINEGGLAYYGRKEDPGKPRSEDFDGNVLAV